MSSLNPIRQWLCRYLGQVLGVVVWPEIRKVAEDNYASPPQFSKVDLPSGIYLAGKLAQYLRPLPPLLST